MLGQSLAKVYNILIVFYLFIYCFAEAGVSNEDVTIIPQMPSKLSPLFEKCEHL